jgi:hypothetical protein
MVVITESSFASFVPTEQKSCARPRRKRCWESTKVRPDNLVSFDVMHFGHSHKRNCAMLNNGGLDGPNSRNANVCLHGEITIPNILTKVPGL